MHHHANRFRSLLHAAAWLVVGLIGSASGQTNVRAWSAAGQVFVVWRVDASAPLTYDVYRSSTPVTSTAQATLAGRVFRPEWEGERLKLVTSTATWRGSQKTLADGSVPIRAASSGPMRTSEPGATLTKPWWIVRGEGTHW